MKRPRSCLECLEHRRTLDNDAPYVIDMLPGESGSVLVRMSEEVINLDWTDFRFKHDDQFIDLSSDAITAASSTEFTVLLPETVDGLFELQLVALESDITDLSGNALRQDASVEITIQGKLQPGG